LHNLQTLCTFVILIHEVEKLSRTGHTSWSLTDVDFLEGPYLDANISTTTISMSAHTVGTGRTLTASAVTGVNGWFWFFNNRCWKVS
jgi:hypothetical protein